MYRLTMVLTMIKKIISMKKIKLITKRLIQTARLMVGVHDYQNYLLHMQTMHPHARLLTEKEFYWACLNARYPKQGGKMGRCPC